MPAEVDDLRLMVQQLALQIVDADRPFLFDDELLTQVG